MLKAIKKSVQWFMLVSAPLALLVVLLNLILIFAGVDLSLHTTVGNVIALADATTAIIMFILFLGVLLDGIPCYQKCPKCGKRCLWFSCGTTGSDVSEPDKYEHIHEIKECLYCDYEEITHYKIEKRHPPHDYDLYRRNRWQ